MALKHFLLGVCLLYSLSLIQGKPHIFRPDFSSAIANQYIVVFKNGLTSEQRHEHIANVSSVRSTFDLPNFSGYSATLDDNKLEQVRSSELVAYIEQDQIMKASQSCQIQKDATWGIDRLDSSNLDLQGMYTYSHTGSGVDAYIVDTGIYTQNEDFEGRAIWGANFAEDGVDDDCNGHGTHVAGTVGSTTYGVAKDVTLIAVKVLGCNGSGTNSGVISGIQYVADEAAKRKRPSVANMSLGGSSSTALDSAIESAIRTGVTFVVAAGNSDADACNYSPARVPQAITVGATGTSSTDERASFSNYGTCVDVFGPGELITSTWIGSTTAIETISGTSMASPHAAGVAALLLEQFPTSTPADIADIISSKATSGIIELNCKIIGTCKHSPNKLLFNPCS